jgi:uncharacterized LabA/DUF88 family protein
MRQREVESRGGSIRVSIFVDGNNFLNKLYGCDVGAPALAPFVASIVGSGDDLVEARFYAAPPAYQPFTRRFAGMQAANRHVAGLEFFHSYRRPDNREKGIDTALTTDLIKGACRDAYDRAAVVSGDGDLIYAIDTARRLVEGEVRVHLLPGQKIHDAWTTSGVPITRWSRKELLAAGIVQEKTDSPVPPRFAAPRGSHWRARVFAGPLAEQIKGPPADSRSIRDGVRLRSA